MRDVAVRVVLLRPELGLSPPTYAHPGDAGADLVTAVDVVLQPGGRAVVPTGIALELPEGYAGLVQPRSGLAARAGLTMVNAPGTIDAGYRGEVHIALINLDRYDAIALRRGDRVAQLLVVPVRRARFVTVDRLSESARGTGGHGSTGGHALLASEGGT